MADPGLTFPTPEFAVGAVARVDEVGVAVPVAIPATPTGLDTEEVGEDVVVAGREVVCVPVALLPELVVLDDVAAAPSTVVCDPSGHVYSPV